jgi:hypothetical protein
MHETDEDHETREPVDPGPGTYELPDERQGQPPTLMPKVTVELEVFDPDTGETHEQTEFAANLATENWRELLTSLLAFIRAGANERASLADLNGNSHNVRVYSGSNNEVFSQSSTSLGCEIAVGDGGGAAVNPARGDTSLVNRLAKAQVGDPQGGSGKSITSATLQNNSGGSWTVREVGIIHKWSTANAGSKRFLTWHDAVQDTNVPDGDALTVTYTLEWP